MQNIIIDKPYRFVPPYPGTFWMKIFRYYLAYYLRHTWGIASWEIRDADHLAQSLTAGHGIVLAANHSRPCDPMVLGLLSIKVSQPFYTMASWHLFKQGRYLAWLIRRLGAFSVYREGMDREALRTAIAILATAQRPLIMLPEGIVTRTNDRLGSLQDGAAFVARAAARLRAKQTPPGQVVLHPVVLKYFFEGNLAESVDLVLHDLETRFGWRCQRHLSIPERIAKVGEALLTLKELDYLGQVQPGTVSERIAALIEHLLEPLEKEWLAGRHDGAPMERVKRLRSAILPDLVKGAIGPEERTRRWQQLTDTYLVQQLTSYPPDYLNDPVPPERLLETVERYEEDLTDVARIHRPLRVVIQVGPALPVSPTREKSHGEDSLMLELEQQLTAMIRELDVTARKQYSGAAK
jgi:1-acyl-sn-glycerol-3-phosphate acyltransferase